MSMSIHKSRQQSRLLDVNDFVCGNAANVGDNAVFHSQPHIVLRWLTGIDQPRKTQYCRAGI